MGLKSTLSSFSALILWVGLFFSVKFVPNITCNVSLGTLNLAQLQLCELSSV